MTADKQSEAANALHARISWRCRRGARELDLLLSTFMAHGYLALENQQVLAFERLLDHADNELLELLMGRRIAGDRSLADVIAKIQDTTARHP